MKRGTSNKPVIFGFIAFISSLPNAFITYVSSAFVGSYGAAYSNREIPTSEELFNQSIFWAFFLIIISFVAMLASFFAKRFYNFSGIVMMVCALLSLIKLVTFNLFSAFTSVFIGIGAIYCFTQKKVSTN